MNEPTVNRENMARDAILQELRRRWKEDRCGGVTAPAAHQERARQRSLEIPRQSCHAMNATPQEQRYASFRASLGELRVPEVQITTLRYERKQSDVQKRTMERTRKWRAKQSSTS